MEINSITAATPILNHQSIPQSGNSNPTHPATHVDIYVPQNDQVTKIRLEKLMRLQRGPTSIQEQYEIVALFKKINSTQEMVQLVLDLESGPDPYDLSHLLEQDLQEESLRQMVRDKIKSLMPTCSLAWFGDNAQGDLQTALMLMANPIYQNRFVAFIRLVRPLDGAVQKITKDIQTAASHCTSLGWPFPKTLMNLAADPGASLSELQVVLAEYNIHLVHDFSDVKTDFDRHYSQNGALWIVASDTDETTITKNKPDQKNPSTHQKMDLVRGHAEAIIQINKTNPWMQTHHPHFFYTITARQRFSRQTTFHTLKRLASRHQDLPPDMYRDVSLKTGASADALQGRFANGQTIRHEAYGLRKLARLQALLDLWE